jgi:hypothetical protein
MELIVSEANYKKAKELLLLDLKIELFSRSRAQHPRFLLAFHTSLFDP